ncbi:MAG: class I SAM-dependent methyltransferase [Lewinellaceae bacterium]|nr:class I SAM-dependent methyltransferase [Lewinellaceae bacterium]
MLRKTHLHRIRTFWQFYTRAVTVYQLHSPRIFAWAMAVLESDQQPVQLEAIERQRTIWKQSNALVDHLDFGTGQSGPVPLKHMAARAASSRQQGLWLFRTIAWLQPQQVLEIGSSLGIGSAFLAAGAPDATVIALEGCPSCAQTARAFAGQLSMRNIAVHTGAFSESLPQALHQLGKLDFVFFDGNHQKAAVLALVEACLPHIHSGTVFAIDDIYWSEDMTLAWEALKKHPSVRCSVDCYDIGLLFFDDAFSEKQHFSIVPRLWKPWKVF